MPSARDPEAEDAVSKPRACARRQVEAFERIDDAVRALFLDDGQDVAGVRPLRERDLLVRGDMVEDELTVRTVARRRPQVEAGVCRAVGDRCWLGHIGDAGTVG